MDMAPAWSFFNLPRVYIFVSMTIKGINICILIMVSIEKVLKTRLQIAAFLYQDNLIAGYFSLHCPAGDLLCFRETFQ